MTVGQAGSRPLPQPILFVRVLGTPRPKGSLRHVGKGRLVEQLANSPDWRRAVADAAYKEIRCCDDPTCHGVKPGYPHTGPVQVSVQLEFAPPKKRQPYPSTRTTGDIDKHARNILDALQDAAVLKDDALVVDLSITKRYTTGAPGAAIAVWPAADPGHPVPGGAAAQTAARRGPEAMLP